MKAKKFNQEFYNSVSKSCVLVKQQIKMQFFYSSNGQWPRYVREPVRCHQNGNHWKQCNKQHFTEPLNLKINELLQNKC